MPSYFSALSSVLGFTIASSSNAVSTSTYTPTIQWGACDPSVITNPLLSCASFQVPLDYHNASAGNGQIAMVIANATAEPKLGTVFFNPGGPGGSGLVQLNASREFLLNFTGGHYDVVSWDPRGVGLSTPGEFKCFESLEEYTTLFNGTLQLTSIEMSGNFTDPDDLQAMFAQAQVTQDRVKQGMQKCLERNGDMMKYVGTAATVRDMVAMADVLDGPGKPVNYYGISYGTLLGNVFLNMFPDRVGRVIIDGVVDPHIWRDTDISLNWEKFYADADNVYRGFITGCALSGPDGCAISTKSGQTPSDVNDSVQSLLKSARDAVRANPSTPITSGMIRYLALFPEMYFPVTWADDSAVWPQLVQIIEAESQSGNATAAPASAPSFKTLDIFSAHTTTHLLSKRTQSNDSNDSPTFALPAILCSDNVDADPNTNMTDILESIVDASRNISHMFGAVYPAGAYYCNFWPARAVERYAGAFNNTLSNKILVIGNTFDPITPFKAAQLVASEFGDQATLVKVDSFGHTTLGFRSSCIMDITGTFMTNGTLPNGDDTVCQTDSDFEVFPGVNTQSIMEKLPTIGF